MRSLLVGLRLALGTFSIVPVGPLPPLSRDHARWSMLLAPVATVPVGLAVALVALVGAQLHWPALLSGLLAVGGGAYLTRGMHIDGLADTVDGLGAGWDRQRAQAVMKSGDVGPMGVVALIVALGAQAACVGQLAHHPLLVVTAWCLGRAGCLWISACMPSMRESGLGAVMARAVTPVQACVTTVAAIVVWVGVCSLVWPGTLALWLAPLLVIVVNLWLIARCLRVFGGSSGDIFGASVELSTCALLVGASCGGAG